MTKLAYGWINNKMLNFSKPRGNIQIFRISADRCSKYVIGEISISNDKPISYWPNVQSLSIEELEGIVTKMKELEKEN